MLKAHGIGLRIKGNTSLYDHNDNTSDYSKNGAGIENYNFITTAGLKYTFNEVNQIFSPVVLYNPGEFVYSYK